MDQEIQSSGVQVAAYNFLEFLGTVEFPAFVGNTAVLTEGNGIWFGSSFRDWISSDQAVLDAPALPVSRFKIAKEQGATDAQINEDLRQGYIFEDRHLFCAYLLQLLRNQAGGKSGILDNSGRANIFRVRDKYRVMVSVSVRWDSDGRGLHLHCAAYRFGERPWRAGDQVFGATAGPVAG